jgi:hypothetical protein
VTPASLRTLLGLFITAAWPVAHQAEKREFRLKSAIRSV